MQGRPRAADPHPPPPGQPARDPRGPARQHGRRSGPLYRLADYLDQHGRAHRASQIPPAEFWSAAAAHAAPGDQAALGDAAHARGLYRDAAQLHKNAAASGDPRAVATSAISRPACARTPAPRTGPPPTPPSTPGDRGLPAGQPAGAGAHEQAAALAAGPPPTPPSTTRAAWPACWTACGRRARTSRPPRCRTVTAAHAALDDPCAVASLLDSLRAAGADEQAAALAGRAAATPPRQPARRGQPAGHLRAAGRAEQAAALLGRSAAHAALDDPDAVARLLDSLREAGAHEQAAALAGRDPAAHAALDDPDAVARLLDSLRAAGAHEQAAALAGTCAAAHAPLDDPDGVASLLDSLREAGAHEQATALLTVTRRPRPPRRPGRRGPPAGQPAGGGRARAGRRAGGPGRRPRPPRQPGRRGQPAGQPAEAGAQPADRQVTRTAMRRRSGSSAPRSSTCASEVSTHWQRRRTRLYEKARPDC